MTDLKPEIYHAAENPIIINIFNDDEIKLMQTHACYLGWWQTQRQTQKTNTKTNTENEPQHILTHEELKAIEENPRDVAQNEDTHNADEDERQVHLDNSKYDINKTNSKR